MAIETYGRYLRIGDTFDNGRVVAWFHHDPNETDRANGWFYVEYEDGDDLPFRDDEPITLEARNPNGLTYKQWSEGSSELAQLTAFRELARSIVHAKPTDSDEDVLAILEKDHRISADDQGCIGCD